jgi:DNA-binding Lrp family transcriptional regulator
MRTEELSSIQRSLLNDFQHDFPLESRPFKRMADRLGITEEEVIDSLKTLQDAGVISRVGPVFKPNRIGVSTLAAVAVEPERLDEAAELINGFAEVNHNYEREHRFNIWFVVTAPDKEHLQKVLEEIGERLGTRVLDLPMINDFHIDLGFHMQWT